jgi:hypothetical protein
LLLLALGLSAVLLVTRARAPAITEKALNNRWFEADSTEVLGNMSDRFSNNQKVKLHPLFPLLTYPLVSGIMSIGKLSPLEAAWTLNAVCAGLWLGSIYLIMRLLDTRVLDSLVFTALAASSGAAVFWFVMPETYPVGSLTILLALGLVALARHRPVADWWFAVASAASLSITLTNWTAGLIGAFLCKPRRRALAITLIALASVVGLLLLEKALFPGAKPWFISPRGYSKLKMYVLCESQGGALDAARSLYLTSAVVPRIELSTSVDQQGPGGPMLTIQRAAAGSSGVVGQAATLLWGFLLAAGGLALVCGRGDVRFRIALGVTLLGESAVYLVYGEETFLYALNFVPLLILAASLATMSRWRHLVVAAAACLVPLAAWNNAYQLNAALDFPHQPPATPAPLDPRALAPHPTRAAGMAHESIMAIPMRGEGA